jgi:uncharacterized protein DUF4270
MKIIFMLPIMNFMIKLLEKNNYSGVYTQVISLLAVLVLIISFSSCSKDPGQIGYIIQPDDSKLNVIYSDSTSLYCYSQLLDSIRSDKLSVNAFGSLRDPVFGGTTAGFYVQFNLSSLGHSFTDNKELDSLILQLSYDGTYGDTNTNLVAHTYEILEEIDIDLAYYSNLQLPVSSIDYSNLSFIPRTSDSVYIVGDTLPPMLRLNLTDLNTDLGNKLLNADSIAMSSTEHFREYFKGLFIQSQPVNEKGVMVYFGLNSTSEAINGTVLSMYYTVDDTVPLRFDYIVTTATATVNKYEHDYSSASSEFTTQLVDGDTTLGQKKFYVQGYGGVQSIVKFPHIRKWSVDGNIAVNEAKLVLPGFEGDEFFDAPRQLSLFEIVGDGTGTVLPDAGEGGSYFDGEYNESLNQYEFRITRYIQSLISDTTLPSQGLYLSVFGGYVYPERFIFKGNEMGTDTTGLRLEMLYTRL